VDYSFFGKGQDMQTSIKIIYLARHGETTANRENKILGKLDFPLTKEGIKGSEKAGKLLSGENMDIILSSPLGRAYSTARIMGKEMNKPIVIHPCLSELSCGLWEGKDRNEVLPPGKPLRRTWDETPPQGESFQDREEELKCLVRQIKDPEYYQRILIVGHGGINQLFLSLWFNLEKNPQTLPLQPHPVIYQLAGDSVGWMDAGGNKGKGWWRA